MGDIGASRPDGTATARKRGDERVGGNRWLEKHSKEKSFLSGRFLFLWSYPLSGAKDNPNPRSLCLSDTGRLGGWAGIGRMTRIKDTDQVG